MTMRPFSFLKSLGLDLCSRRRMQSCGFYVNDALRDPILYVLDVVPV
jgi:hypothetical protein